METIKKMNLSNDIKVAQDFIVRTLILVCFLYLFEASFWVNLIIILSTVIPSVYLHLMYSMEDEHKMIVIEEDKMILKNKDKSYDLHLSEQIIFQGSVGLTRNIIPLFISPNYYKITFISKVFGEVTITSLLDLHIKDEILKRFDENKISYDYFILY